MRDMATKENNIALSFDKAEYYTLQEASEYLNRKHGIDNITPRKLLKHIVSYDTPCFIYGKGFNFFGEYEIELTEQKKQELESLSDEEINEYYEYLLKWLDLHTSVNFDNLNDGGGGFICIDVCAERILTDGFCLSDNACVIDLVPLFAIADYNVDKEYHYLAPISKEVIFDFHGVKNFKITYLKIIERSYEKEIELTQNYLKNNIHLEFVGIGENASMLHRESDCNELIFKIKQENLVIFDKDLNKLEKQIIENAPIPKKENHKNNSVNAMLGRQGISPKKAQAKLIANAHAQHLWAKDHDKQIRISEMCENVWAYMIETDYKDQLPEKRENLKDWLINTPPHASNKGRPSNS